MCCLFAQNQEGKNKVKAQIFQTYCTHMLALRFSYAHSVFFMCHSLFWSLLFSLSRCHSPCLCAARLSVSVSSVRILVRRAQGFVRVSACDCTSKSDIWWLSELITQASYNGPWHTSSRKSTQWHADAHKAEHGIRRRRDVRTAVDGVSGRRNGGQQEATGGKKKEWQIRGGRKLRWKGG